MCEEEQIYIDHWCEKCGQERVFITTLSPKGDIVCTTCRSRIPTNKSKMIEDKFGYRFVKGK